MNINCSVTVMPICTPTGEIGFIRRGKDDTFGELLVAPGGRIEPYDGQNIDGVMYWSAELAARRELLEEVGIDCYPDDFVYFCSLTLPNGRVVISLYIMLDEKQGQNLEWYTKEQIEARDDFAPGMREEALILIRKEYG